MVHEAVLPQLEALEFDPQKPLLAVDVDEVLVGLAGHLGEFAEANGFALKLTSYKLDGALKRGDGSDASPEEFRDLFKQFFDTQTLLQRVYPDAAPVLNRLSEQAQVLILTNVPPYAREDRIENLRGHGIDFPLVVNHGGKGETLAWLAGKTNGIVAFIDDSPSQMASAAKYAPDVHRLHFVGDAHLRGILGPLPDAHHSPKDWLEIEDVLKAVFDGNHQI